VKKFQPKVSDSEINELFAYFYQQETSPKDDESALSTNQMLVSLSFIDVQFEKWFR
jgi:hypothetical protein